MDDAKRNWTLTAGGWIKDVDRGVTSLARFHKGVWRLSRIETWRMPVLIKDILSSDERPVGVFENASFDECVAYDEFLDRFDAWSKTWESSSFEETLPLDDHPGMSIKVTKKSGNREAFCLLKQEGESLNQGSYMFMPSRAETCFIAGEWVFHGHSSLKPAHIGKGLGLALYDAAEKVSGMTAVPSGRDFTPGELSAYSTAFWEKRSARRTLPTMTSEADERRSLVAAGTEIPRLERENRGNAAFTIALADITGGRIFGFVSDEDGVRNVPALWAELPDGRWMNENGTMDGEEARTMIKAAIDEIDVVRQGRLDLADLSAILKEYRAAVPGFLPFRSDNLINDVVDRLPAASRIARRHLGLDADPVLSEGTLSILSKDWDTSDVEDIHAFR